VIYFSVAVTMKCFLKGLIHV